MLRSKRTADVLGHLSHPLGKISCRWHFRESDYTRVRNTLRYRGVILYIYVDKASAIGSPVEQLCLLWSTRSLLNTNMLTRQRTLESACCVVVRDGNAPCRLPLFSGHEVQASVAGPGASGAAWAAHK